MNVEIKKLDHQGRGIGKLNGKTIFVPFACPEEIVDVNIVKDKKKYCEGEIKSFLKTSPNRVLPVCPFFGTCGGCDLMHLDYRDQVYFKEQKIKEIIEKFTNISSAKITSLVECLDPLYYRNKITFQVKNGIIGLYEKKSNRIIPVEKCYISTPKINKILEKLRKVPLDMVHQIVVRTDDIIEEIMVIIYLKKEINGNIFINQLKDDVTSLVTIVDGKEEIIYGKGNMIFELGEFQFELSPTAFFQVNTKQCQKLYDKVLEFAAPTKEDIILDLYCGTGTIGIYLAKYAKEVMGIEIHKGAIQNAIHNKELNNISNINFEAGDAQEIVQKLIIKPTIVVVDPPRRGLDEKTIQQILKWNSKKVVYVSCDPMTLARDLNLLEEKYEVEKITPIDMFPNTNHVECVCVLEMR